MPPQTTFSVRRPLRSTHFNSASNAGHSACPHSVRLCSTSPQLEKAPDVAAEEMEQEPLSAVERDGATIVAGRVAADFPGSPVTLDHVFRLEGDKIVSLEIR